MHDYEIRIFNPDGSVALIMAEIHLCDSAAIRAGRGIAGGLKFEVWRGMDCIHGARLPGASVPASSAQTGNAGYRH